jgi:hypothetical protein
MNSEFSALSLERFVLEELPLEEQQAIARALETDADLRGRVEALKASNASIFDRRVRVESVAAIRARSAHSKPVRRLGPTFVWASALVTVAIMSAVLLRPAAFPVPDTPEVTRLKGAPSVLRVFRKTSNGSEPVPSGARAAKGDLVRLGYQTFAPRYGVIVSVDGRNNVTRHWPSRGDQALPLQGGELVLLDEAFELDDAPRFERFYLVTSTHGFPIESALAWLRVVSNPDGGQGSPSPADFEFTSVELKKERSQ